MRCSKLRGGVVVVVGLVVVGFGVTVGSVVIVGLVVVGFGVVFVGQGQTRHNRVCGGVGYLSLLASAFVLFGLGGASLI